MKKMYITHMRIIGRYFVIIMLLLSASIVQTKLQVEDKPGEVDTAQELEKDFESKSQDETLTMDEMGSFVQDLPIPPILLPLFDKLAIKKPQFAEIPAGITGVGFSVTGSVFFKGYETRGTIIVIDTPTMTREFSIAIEVPVQVKLSDIFPQFKKLDSLSFPSGKFIISTFNYEDEQFQADVRPGFNFVAKVDLKGPLQKVQTFFDKVQKYVAVAGTGQAVFEGFIPEDIKGAEFNIALPFQMGVDFEKLHKIGKLKKKPTLIKNVFIGNLKTGISPIDLSMQFTGGMTVGLVSQQDPLEFNLRADFGVTKAEFTGYMDGIYSPAFGQSWLSLGNFGLKIDIDYVVESALILLGVPFTGIEFMGEFRFGTGKDQVVINPFVGAVELTSNSIGNMAFIGGINQMSLRSLVALASKIIKKDIPLDKIPTISFKNVEFWAVPSAITIGDKYFSDGVSLKGEWDILGFKGGFALDSDLNLDGVSGGGWINPLSWPAKNPVIKLSGFGPDQKYGTADDKIAVEMSLTPKKQQITGSAVLEIPPFDLMAGADLFFGLAKIRVIALAKIQHYFSTLFDINITSFNKKDETKIQFDFQQDFTDFIKNDVVQKLEEFKKQAQEDIRNIDNKIAEFQKKINDIRGGFSQDTQQEIDRVNRRISQINKEIRDFKSECDKAKWYEKAIKKACLNIPTKELEKKGLEAYRETLLQPGRALADLPLALINQLAQSIKEFEAIEKVAIATVNTMTNIMQSVLQGATIFVIKKAHGEISTVDLNDGKLPLLSVTVEINIPNKKSKEVVLNDLQFDFKHPIDSSLPIIFAIIGVVQEIFS